MNKKFIAIICFVFIFFAAGFVFAQEIPKEGIFNQGISPSCLECGECTQCDGMQIMVNIVNFLFNIAGPLAVLAIILAGFLYITSGGNPEQAQSAKGALTAGLIGFVIILIAWVSVDYVIKIVGYEKAGSWFRPDLNCPKTICKYFEGTIEIGTPDVSSTILDSEGKPIVEAGEWANLIDGALQRCPAEITPRTGQMGEFDKYYNKYGKQYGINPYLIKAIAMQESGENPKIENKQGGGDFGMMQFIPETAATFVSASAPTSCKKKVSGKDYSKGEGYCTNRRKSPDPDCCQNKANSCGRYASTCKEWLTENPEKQVEMGANLISRNVRSYSGNLDKAIAAYNGPGNFPYGSSAPYVQKIHNKLRGLCQ
jgi:hypothetical protein